MIRMIQSSSASHAKAYFSDALQKSDYYINDQELQGQFHGRLSDRMGITGIADKQSFFDLCENINPATGATLTPRNKEDRTTGYDINFHCPKSVSIVHALSGDEHILKAFQKSVNDTMLDIEADSMTRVRKKGQYEDRYTGELAWAEFTHQTARPVDGSVPDPHLHSHCFVFNATWDEKEKQIKAGQFRDIKRDMPYYQARFHKRLSDNLIDQGYRIRLTDKSFEIEGVPKSAIDLFSKRTDEIGQFAKERGITDARQMSELGAKTRSKKQKGLSMGELKREWKEQIMSETDYSESENNQTIRFAPKAIERIAAKDCVDYAVNHSFERVSVMADRRLLATAYRHGIGTRSIAVDGITEVFKNDDRIIRVKEKYRSLCTTKEVLAEEKRMVYLARKGQGKFSPLYNEVPNIKLKEQQRAAIEHLLTTKHQVSIVRGIAGSGKTTMLKEAKEWIEKKGKKLTVVAPTAQASRGVLVDDGFKEAQTVSRLLVDKEMQKELHNQVLMVDEAGLLGTKDMIGLLELADKQNARLILVGDTRQHSSVVRGDALRVINTVAGIKTAEISKIRRQEDVHYKAAVEDLAKGNVKDAFIKLTSIGAIKNVDPLKPNDDLVNDYLKTIKKGKSALMVSPTHKQGEAVTDELRLKLKSEGVIGKKELPAVKLTNLNFTEAEKTDYRNFEKGQIIQFNQNVPKIKRGSFWMVSDTAEDRTILKNGEGKEQVLPRDKASAYDVFTPSILPIAKGDKIRITKNGFDKENKRLNNGQYLDVISVNKSGQIKLINKVSKSTYTLDKDFGHIDHAYCTTSHSSQGKTVDEVFISQPSSTFTATDAKQIYVSVSRGKDKVTIYTDDRATLLEYASEMGDRQSAIELVNNRPVHSDYVVQKEREKYFAKDDNTPTKENITLDKDRDHEPGF